MNRIKLGDSIFAAVVVLGLVFATKPFFTKHSSKPAEPSESVTPKIAVTTLELTAESPPPRENGVQTTEKICDNSTFILADSESSPSKEEKGIEVTVDETHVPDDTTDVEYSRADDGLSVEVEQAELSEYPYGRPTPNSTQVVDALTISVTGDRPLTRENVTQWKADLADLVSQGEEAFPAIWEYLNSFEDAVFLPADARALGYPSSRMALLDAVQQIGGDEAIELSLQMLEATADPKEIAFLAKMLAEQETNEEAREAAIAAAREVLDMVKSGEIDTEEDEERVDVGPLFEVLHKYGDDRVVADLQQATGEYRYYASIALANLPDGAGIPALIDMAKGDNELPSSVRSQALVMLAQVSTQSEAARTTLVKAAQSNQIPEFYWNHIASSLAGATYRLETEDTTETTSNASKNRKFHHIEGTNQNFITDSSGVDWSEEEIDERLDLIDELLAVNSSPKAVELLRKSQGELEARFDQLTSKQVNN